VSRAHRTLVAVAVSGDAMQVRTQAAQATQAT